MDKGRADLRGTHLCGVKKAIGTWPSTKNFTPSIAGSDNSIRGFLHDQCGYLLCPIDYDWEDNEYVNSTTTKTGIHMTLGISVKAGIRNHNPQYKLSADLYPRFLWEDSEYDLADLNKGFARSAIMVEVMSHRQDLRTLTQTLLGRNTLHS